MLGVVSAMGDGGTDRLFAEVSRRLVASGLRVAGAVQVDGAEDGRRIMTLCDIASGKTVRISQDLGRDAAGCTLDPAGLEEAVGLVAASVNASDRPALVIVNKFGKQEAEGRGFRPLIGAALGEGIPVLIAVGEVQRPTFDEYAGEFAEPVAATPEAVLAWLESATAP